jgi:hypothetical protein
MFSIVELSRASCKTRVLISIKGFGIIGDLPFNSANEALDLESIL